MPVHKEDNVREYGGRVFNGVNYTYKLPADEEEYDRLAMQHRIITLSIGLDNNVPHLIKTAISSGGANPAAIDMGTGSGHWAIEFATEYPQVSVLGIDLVPPKPKCDVPSNCSFEQFDANFPLTKYLQSFNVCHARAIDSGINNNEDFIYRMPSVLRKDGVLLMGSGEVQFCTEDKTFCPIDVEEGQPDWYAIQTIFREGFKDQLIRGGGAEIKRRWEILLGENPFLSSFGVDDVYVPIGPWLTDQDDTSVYASKLMQSNILHLIGALRYRLVSNGLDEATIDRWAKIAKEEVTNMNPKLYVKWRYAWGVRNSLEWVPKPVDSITKS